MGLKQCRLLSTKTVSGTCSINHQWSPDIVSILIRCNQTFCIEINWTESIISSKDLGKCLGMFCLGCWIPNRRWFPRLQVHLSIYLRVYSLHHNVLPTLQSIPLMTSGPLYPITQDSSCHGQHTMPRNPWSFPWPVPHSCVCMNVCVLQWRKVCVVVL